MDNRNPPFDPAFAGPAMLAQLRAQWGWLVGLGAILVLLGMAALVYMVTATVASMLVLAWILIFAGIVEGVHTLRHRTQARLFLHLLNAVLSVVMGALILRDPQIGAVALTLLLAAYFLVAGGFRVVAAFKARGTPGWPWILVSGVISLILGAMLWGQWPASGLWAIGMFVGIDLLMVGWSQIMIGFALRAMPH